jgi:hypothetical protein
VHDLIATGDAAVSGGLQVARELIATVGVSGVVPSQTAFLKSALYQLNQPISAGSYLEPRTPGRQRFPSAEDGSLRTVSQLRV